MAPLFGYKPEGFTREDREYLAARKALQYCDGTQFSSNLKKAAMDAALREDDVLVRKTGRGQGVVGQVVGAWFGRVRERVGVACMAFGAGGAVGCAFSWWALS